MVTDLIADLLTRLRNAVRAKQLRCQVPASQEKESILAILRDRGYIKNFVRQEQAPQDVLIVTHKYLGKNQKPVLNRLQRVSKPGCRVYRGYREIKPLLGGLGVTILSTPQGIIAGDTARQKKVGGEVLCEIW